MASWARVTPQSSLPSSCRGLLCGCGFKTLFKDEDILKATIHSTNDANESLKNEITNFQRWNTAAGEGKKIFQAATAAKKAVESQVKEALQAVVNMDKSLKRDLKSVKDKIKGGIGSVIRTLGVNDLDKNVRQDLGELKRKIEGLATDGGEKLAQVDKAIGTLGGKFTGLTKDEERKSLQKILEEIHRKVAAIKGAPGKTNGDGGKGLDGINQKIGGLARAFVPGNGQNGFNARVDGWLEGVIGNKKDKPGLQAVNSWLGTYIGRIGRNGDDIRETVKKQVMAQLTSQIGAAQGTFNGLKNDIEKNKITENLAAIKQACEEFVDKLDKELANNKIGKFATTIAGKIEGKTTSTNSDLTTAVKSALVALCASVKQVATEVQSLGIDRFGTLLDEVHKTTTELHGQLEQATQKVTSSGTTEPNISPAQAVDSRLNDVREFMSGSGNNNITVKFNTDVTSQLKTAVTSLHQAVDTFDQEAQKQIKEAAKTAYLSKALSDWMTSFSGPKYKS
ncbi:Extracellular matrix-binding ebh, putative [Babesia ovata]|uniref:Extracellular matrix-binding ebh, putative n=1 Tax=Babesia ovata TaxID=189622 RepID=A0A2H6KDP2_9APIC|nr:Extracellular matrix-binding ebh, putative [Babesia ovata]GBE61120.1 Extracellular matrix-binding ebh, putative [Babesia ovata]